MKESQKPDDERGEMIDNYQDSAISRFGDLLADAKAIASEAAAFKRIAALLSKPEGYEQLKKVEHELAQLDSFVYLPNSAMSATVKAAEDVRNWLASEWHRRASMFTQELMVYLDDRALPSEVDGDEVKVWPFILTLNPRQDRADLTYAGEPIGKTLPLSCPAIHKAILNAQMLLEKNQTPPEVFADELIASYEDACNLRGTRVGGRVRLPEVHFSMFARRQTSVVKSDPRRSRIKEYPRYQFAWDLALLLKNSPWLERGAKRITLHPASATAAKGKADSVRIVTIDHEDLIYGDVQVG